MSLITISRPIGCGAREVAPRLADALGVDLFDDERFREEALKMGVKSEELERLGHRMPGFFDRLRDHKPELYIDLMESVVYEMAKRGRGVIVGHACQILLRDVDCAFHVLLHASEQGRVRYLTEAHGLGEKAARELIRKDEEGRGGFFRYAYHSDWRDVSLYDLVINTETMGTDLAFRLILDAAKSETVRACGSDAVDALARLSLKRKVQAELIANYFSSTYLHVEVPEAGNVHVSGLFRTPDEKARLEALMGKIPGVEVFTMDVSIF